MLEVNKDRRSNIVKIVFTQFTFSRADYSIKTLHLEEDEDQFLISFSVNFSALSFKISALLKIKPVAEYVFYVTRRQNSFYNYQHIL